MPRPASLLHFQPWVRSYSVRPVSFVASVRQVGERRNGSPWPWHASEQPQRPAAAARANATLLQRTLVRQAAQARRRSTRTRPLRPPAAMVPPACRARAGTSRAPPPRARTQAIRLRKTPEPRRAAEPRRTPDPRRAAEPRQTPEPRRAAEPRRTPDPRRAAEPRRTLEPRRAAEPMQALPTTQELPQSARRRGYAARCVARRDDRCRCGRARAGRCDAARDRRLGVEPVLRRGRRLRPGCHMPGRRLLRRNRRLHGQHSLRRRLRVRQLRRSLPIVQLWLRVGW